MTFVDLALIERIASRCDVDVYILSMTGTTVDPRTPLVGLTGAIADPERAALTRAFRVQPHRDYEQDPRLGVIALTEIGSRALSTATNDPGTAIEVIAALQRVFDAVLSEDRSDDVTHGHVHLRPVGLEDLVTDAFRPIARDGAAVVEVQIRLQKCLAALARCAPTQGHVFRAMADHAYDRARHALDEWDVDDLERVHFAEFGRLT